MAEYKIYDFLESNDFEKESSTFTSFVISQVVKPDNIEGFVFSWFTDYDDPRTKKEILPYELRENPNAFFMTRNPALFDFEKLTISLTEEEVKYINNNYFIAQLEKNYKKLYADLDAFHRHFESQNRYSLKECYDTIVYFLNDSRGTYNGNISNIHMLTVTTFKDLIEHKLLRYRNAVEAKRLSLENIGTAALAYDNSIFKSAQAFEHFKEYANSCIEEPYKDYSYLFQRMLDEDYIHEVKHFKFAGWLRDKGYITQRDYEFIIEEGNFRSLKKSESKSRKTNFENIFY